MQNAYRLYAISNENWNIYPHRTEKSTKYLKSKSLSSTTMALFYITICTVLCVSHMAITQPSDRYDYSAAWDQRSTTCPVYSNTTETNVLPYVDLIQYPIIGQNWTCLQTICLQTA